MPTDTTLPEPIVPEAEKAEPSHRVVTRRMVRGETRGTAGCDADGSVAGGVEPLDGQGPAEGDGAADALTDFQRGRVALVAQARYRALLAAFWTDAKWPRCETNDGKADKARREIDLINIPHAYTRTGRSFIFKANNPGYVPGWLPYWLAVVGSEQLPRKYASRSGALAAARRREKKAQMQLV